MSDTALLDAKALSAATQMSVRLIKTLKKQRKIPFLRIGHRTIRYQLPEVLAALHRFEVKPVAP